MAENNLTVPLEELDDENEMILNDLELSQKRIEFLQNYRKVLIELSVKCICNQNKPIIKSIESLETQFHQLFSEYNDIKSEDIIETIDERSEDNNDFGVVAVKDERQQNVGSNVTQPEEEAIDSNGDNNSISESIPEEIIETIDERSNKDKNDCEVVVFVDESLEIMDLNVSQMVSPKPVVQKLSTPVPSYSSIEMYTKNKDSVLVYNKNSNTIVRKSVEEMNETNESIIERFVLKDKTSHKDIETVDKSSAKPLISNQPIMPKPVLSKPVLSNPPNFEYQSTRAVAQTQQLAIPPNQSYFMNSGQQTILLPITTPLPSNIPLLTFPPNVNPVQSSGFPQMVNIQSFQNPWNNLMSIQSSSVPQIIGFSNPIEGQNEEAKHITKKKKKMKPRVRNAQKMKLLEKGIIDSFTIDDHETYQVYLRKDNVSEDGVEISQVMYKCTECGEESKHRNFFHRHASVHKKRVCFASFPTELMVGSDDEPEKAYECVICRKRFDSQQRLTSHKSTDHRIPVPIRSSAFKS